MARTGRGKLIFSDRIINRGNKNEDLERDSLISAENAWQRSRRKAESLQEDISKMSEEKARKLFETEEAKLAWIAAIKKSVEHNIQSQVRAALGTPPEQRRKKLFEMKREEEVRRRKLQLEVLEERRKQQMLSFRTRCQENDIRDLSTRRQQYMQKYNTRRTQRTYLEFARDGFPNVESAIALDPLSSDFSKHFSPYTRAALENLDRASFGSGHDGYKRAVGTIWTDHSGHKHEILGPFWPRDHLPKHPSQNHVRAIPSCVEPLNTPAENNNVQVKTESPLYSRPWRGTMVVYDRQTKGNMPHDVSQGCAPSLEFESRFECGNLRQTKRIGTYEYDLVLSTDLYTKRHTQWYYFQVQKMVPGVTYKFNIINLLKRDSLYNYGMRPLLYSERKTQSESGVGWSRVGHHVGYLRNFVNRNILLSRDQVYFTLTFQLEFPYGNDVCYLAHCYPYSYTDLELYLRTLEDSPLTSHHCRREVLCKTLAGNNCYQLTVTSPRVPDCEKLGVVVSARVHPGETNASWMMKGLLDFLTSEDPIAEKLRQKFVFKIVPMLNPDGVIVGNYRTNLAGRDLNRTYKDPKREHFPTTWHTKTLMESFSKDHEVVIYCDLHGHSRKPNVFMYGCTADSNMVSVNNFLQERLFPWMMSQKAPDKFSFSGCKFRVRKCKESTARVVMWRQLGIQNSFTMEATFCGANFGDMEKGRHFNTADFEAMGKHFCEVLLEYSEARGTNKNEVTQAFVELACKMTRDILRQTQGTFHNITSPNTKKHNTHDNGEPHTNESSESEHKKAPQDETSKRVNFMDVEVHPRKLDSNGSVDGGVELSVRSVHVDSFKDCIKILEGLDLANCYNESDSSDSDSESDGDDDNSANSKSGATKNSEDRKKRKKKKKKKDWWETLSKPQEIQKEETETEESDKKEKVKMKFGKFKNPYASRHNGGIPTYSDERIMERAKKKEQLSKAAEEERRDLLVKYSADDPNECYPLLAFTDDTELNFITAQRRLAYYMLTRNNAGAGVKNINNHGLPLGNRSAPLLPNPRCEPIMEVDSFKFDHLSGGGYGFTIRIPGKEHTQNLRLPDRIQNGRKTIRDDNLSRQRSVQSFEEVRRVSGLGSTTLASTAHDSLDSTNGMNFRVAYSNPQKEPYDSDFEPHVDISESQDYRQEILENGGSFETAMRTKGRRLNRGRSTENESLGFDNHFQENKRSLTRCRSESRLQWQQRAGVEVKGRDQSPEFVPSVIPSYSHVNSRHDHSSSVLTKHPNCRN